MSYGWGKAIVYLFLIIFTLSNSKTSVIEWIIVILFFVAGCFNVYLFVKFREDEDRRIKVIWDQIDSHMAKYGENDQ